MISKLILTLGACAILGVAVDHGTGEGEPRSNTSPSMTCDHKADDIKSALHNLFTGEFSQVEQARPRLLKYAKESQACRQAVVHSVMKNMDIPNLKFEGELANYLIWREGAILLGELQATEALDLLISHLDLNNGFHSGSKIFQPAILGVSRIGKAAVPKLTVALLESQKVGVRMAAAYCLTVIGGRSAMDALKKAQRSETDRCVARYIHISLDTFSYKSHGRIRFDNDAPQANLDMRRNWMMAFECVETTSATAN
jgi:hypothetical protein